MLKLSENSQYIFIINDSRHVCYFSSLLAHPNVHIYCENSGLKRKLSTKYSNQKFISENEIQKLKDNIQKVMPIVLVPVDLSGALHIFHSSKLLNDLPSLGFSASIVDPNWIIQLNEDANALKFNDIAARFDGVVTPDLDPFLHLRDTTIVGAGLFVQNLPHLAADARDVLVISDFSGYQLFDEPGWLKDVTTALANEKIEFRELKLDDIFSSDTFESFNELLDTISNARQVITTRSFIYYVCRAMLINCAIYDPWRFVSTSFSRDLLPNAAYIRNKNKIKEIFSSSKSRSHVDFKLQNNSGSLSQIRFETAVAPKMSQGNGIHIVLWGRMPAHSYSGGRYHAWLLAEGFSALGYDVTFFSDNCPYFLDDFSQLPGHRKITLQTTTNFEDVSQFPELTASVVIVIPGMDRSSELYKGAIDYSRLCEARIALINFESPNWFNAMVSPPRDETLWKYWEILSKFSSLILSTTETSNKYAKDYYISAPADAKFGTLYAPINSTFSDARVQVLKKEKRIIIFFPRHGYSAHKGWQQIVNCIGDGFINHTVVFLCGESELPIEILDQLDTLSKTFSFDIEYKVKVNDREKFEELSRACLLIFPSQFEGYGYPPLEALAVGTPCVAFDLPVLRETCRDHLLYAPKGDFETFQYLCNKALKDSFRLTQGAIERATEIAHFSSFCDRLKIIAAELLDSAPIWKIFERNETKIERFIEKAFFDEDSFIESCMANLPDKIDAKAIVKEQLATLKVSPGKHQPIPGGTRVLLLVKKSSKLGVEIGAGPTQNYFNFAQLKKITIDVLSEDFAIETLRERFVFSGGKYISIGQGIDSKIREDVKLILLELLNQYSYSNIITVDGFLRRELNTLQYHPRCPVVYCLVNDADAHTLDSNFYDNIFVADGNKSFTHRKDNTPYLRIPDFILPSLDRKGWLVSSHAPQIVTFSERVSIELREFFAGMETLRAKMGNAKFDIGVSVISPNDLSNLPYFVRCLQANNNEQLYNYLKRGAIFVALVNSTTALRGYVETLASLIGACVIRISDFDNSEEGWTHEVMNLLQDQEKWKQKRISAFNEVLNKIASPSYLNGIFPETNEPPLSFARLVEQSRREFKNDHCTTARHFKTQLKKSLDGGNLETAVELARRYRIGNNSIAVSLLAFELGFLNRDFGLCQTIYTTLRSNYPFEGLFLILATRINIAIGDINSACQVAYYGAMLDTGDLQVILNAAEYGIKGQRDIDNMIHKIMYTYIGEHSNKFLELAEKNAKTKFLVEALIEEHNSNGVH